MTISFTWQWWYIFIPIAIMIAYNWLRVKYYEDYVIAQIISFILVPFALGALYGHFVS